uniref:Bassianolide synthetase n=1 Tax=Beauveria bassiana TaxID=176275 RepID=J7HFG9_BEABA|nr:bassianolide synthetase [Beauveria bassiana]
MEPPNNANTGQLGPTVPNGTVDLPTDLSREITRHFGLEQDEIEEILPCTPFQRDVIECASDDKRRAVGHVVYEIPEDVDTERLAAAWKATVRYTPALRTCIFTSETGNAFQVVLRDCFIFARMYCPSTHLKSAIVKDEASAAVAGPRCNRYVLIGEPNSKRRVLIWTFSHSFVDSAFQGRILQQVLAAYKDGHGRVLSLQPTTDLVESENGDHLSTPASERTVGNERATQFWQEKLHGLDASVFPRLPSHKRVPAIDARADHYLPCSPFIQHEWSRTTVCRTALAILLARYTHSCEALFGVVTEQSHEEHPLLLDGPTSTVVPFRVPCALNQSVSKVMEAITTYDHDMRQFAHAGLCNISRIGDDASAACGFQTVLMVTDSRTASDDEIHQVLEESDKFIPCTDRALLLSCQMTDEGVLLVARYDQSILESLQMDRFLRQLGFLISKLQSTDGSPCVGQLDVLAPEDGTEIESWNSEPLQTQDYLIHSEVVKNADDTPDKPAVCAWDGEWTYSELNNVSSRLASYISSLDLGQQLIVPIYFEKSKWVMAAILAVLKAGHAFTLIDPNDPPARTAQIIKQASASIAITSALHQSKMQTVVGRCITVDDDLVQTLTTFEGSQIASAAKPGDLAYVIFTSGSTGDPKGIMIEHRAFYSSVVKFGKALGIRSSTRALQFATHGFGAFLLEVLTTLIHGGCICIPSDHDRMHNIPGFIRQSQINWMMATPSYMTTMKPDDVPGLETLVLVGEQMSLSINDVWLSELQLLDGYGQSESSSICFVGKISDSSRDPNNLGRAIGAHSWIINPDNPDQLVPIGAIGELLIESPGIARGYLFSQSTETPFLERAPAWYASKQPPYGVKFYRTGDLARYAPDGTVICLGRMDSQVKIRGQRVELDAIENLLRQQFPSDVTVVAEAVKRSDLPSSVVITGFLISSEYVVGAPNTEDTYILDQTVTQEINAKMRQILPAHSIPSFYICMKTLPRTATGKVDRRKLRSIGSSLLALQAQSTAPRSSQAPEASAGLTKLEEVWMDMFNLTPNSHNIGGNFFALGGDSITAIKMVNMARAAGIQLKVSDIFQNPTLASLQAAIGGSSMTVTSIPALALDGPVEQSYSQGRLWFLDQLEIGANWYTIPYAVRLRGPLDIDALNRALLALEKRHETLRTTFEDQDGVGVQIIHETLLHQLRIIDADHADHVPLLKQEQTAPFNLASESGWRVSLIRLDDDDNILSIVMHHIISDGWSIDVLRRELGQLYAAALHGADLFGSTLSPLPIQYRDFSVWQKQDAQVAEHERQLQYWQKQLADCSPAKLPTDFHRPALLSGKATTVPVTITSELYHRLQEFCSTFNTTSFVVLLATFRAAHYRLTGVDDAVIGTPIANRNRHELENLIGFFVNTQCMRITINEDEDTFESLVRQVRSTTTAAFEHEDVPFERVVSAMLPGSRDLSQNPLAQLVFAIHSHKDLGKFELEALESEPLQNEVYTRFDAEFHFFQAPDGLTGYINFATELFKVETIQNVVSVFLQILRHGLEHPQTLISVVPLTDGLAELRSMGLLEIKKVEYPRDSSVVDVFGTQVASYPDTLAVVDSSSRLTYAELDHQSDLLATWLRQQNLPTEALVVVLAPRSCETIVTFLGILKANLAYLPLDIRSPITRMRDVLSTLPGRTIALLRSDEVAPDFQLPSIELVRISDALEEAAGMTSLNGHEHMPMPSPSPTSLAYVLYTSGSTGRPKGVMIEHRAIVRLARSDIIPDYRPACGDTMAHMFNTAFDGATYEIYTMLLNGGTLVCVDYMDTLSPKSLEAVFKKEQVNATIMAPALLKLYLADARDALKGLDVLISGGDRFDPQDAVDAQSLVRGSCYNGYGPTENGVFSTVYKVDKNDPFVNGVPLGRAVNNSGAYVVDRNQQLVGPGIIGELVVTGDGLARGYTERAFDENRFIQLKIEGQTVRGYRTGDRVRCRVGEGLIEFFGRMDFQFKIRSNRIEAGEVEAAILSHPAVRNAAVILRVQEKLEPEIVGFVVAEHDDTAEQEEAGDQVQGWQAFFESTTYTELDTVSSSEIGKDFKGWTSMYDGNEINKAEMQEWLDDTIHTLTDGQALGHVLEIGTGSGMVLFNLGSGLQSFVGLEPSKSAAAFVNNAIKSTPALAGKAQVFVGTATDTNKLEDLHPDLVIFNSVLQYFPTRDYLEQVVDALVHLRSAKRIFFGDVRSYATNRHFLAARAIYTLGNHTTKDEVRKKMAEMEEREEEFLVEPAFFTTLANRLPDVRHVEIIPKNMQATNELSAYRYAAVVHLRGSDELTRPVHPIKMDDWVDFQASHMHKDALREYLRLAENTKTVAISNIPYGKTIFERQVVESLDDTSEDAPHASLDGAAWISAVRSDAKARSSLSVPDLVLLAKETGFRVEVSAARQWSQSGALDAVFHRYHPAEPDVRTLFQFPTDNDVRMSAPLTNQPLQRLQKRRVAVQVREWLQDRIPSYMIPSHIVALDQMPLNTSGKVDRKELSRQAKAIKKGQKSAPPTAPTFPLSEVEVMLCEELTKTFEMDVNMTDDFFQLGGHSLLATRLVARISHRLGARLTVKDVFDYPVFSELADIIRQQLASKNTLLPTASAGGGGQDKKESAGVAPTTDMEAMLCEEFANILGMDVGITDNFFDLGGHSLMATRLAARIGHKLNTTISVKDIFSHPVIFQLSAKLEVSQLESSSGGTDIKMPDYTALQLIPVADAEKFMQDQIYPQINFPQDMIQDVYLATHLQQCFLRDVFGRPKPLVPFYVEFPPDSNPHALATACTSLVDKYDIFRTIFVEAEGNLYQVVLTHLNLDIDVVETDANVHKTSSDLVDAIAKEPVRLGQPMIQVKVLKQTSSVRVLLWLSHALYDGLSWEHIVRDLHILSKERSLPPATQFSRYMQYVDHTQRPGCDFWRDVLQNAPITNLSDAGSGGRPTKAGDPRVWHAGKVISGPSQAIRSSITQATVFNAACAIVLSKETGTDNVVFGRIVSGRQGLPVRWQNIIGPCTNAVPVRAVVDAHGNHQQMLRDLQEQYLLSLPYETIGFDEIKRSCTDWPDSARNYGCCVTYQNFEYHPESEVDQQRVEMGILAKKAELIKEEPLYDVAIAGEVEPDGVHLQVTVVVDSQLFSQEGATHLMEQVCNTFQALNATL